MGRGVTHRGAKAGTAGTRAVSTQRRIALMPMNVTVAEEDKLKRKLSVEVPLDEVQTVYEEVYQRLRTNVRVNGFRPGKFPRQLAEKRFQSVMAGEAMQTLVPKYFDQAVSELKLQPATEPQFDNLEIDKAKPFRFDVAFEVVPTFKLVPPASFKLKEQKAKVGPKEVDARIEELRNARGNLADKGKKAAEAGDWVTFDFHGTLDGEDFDGGHGENQRIEVGAGQYLPDFDAQFPGIKAGEVKEFAVTFPEDYGQATIAGKEVRFRVTAKQVEQKVPAELDEAFFKQQGEEVRTLKDLQAHIKTQLEQEQEREAMQAYQNQLADQMREKYDFEVPEALVHQGLHEFEHKLTHDDPEALKDEQKLEQLKSEERTKIEANLRVAYAVDSLARQYDVKTSEEDVRQRFYLQAYMLRQNPNELAQSPFGRRMMMQIQQQMITAQTLERLAQDVLGAAKGKAGGKKAEGEADAEGKEAEQEGGKRAAGKGRTAKDSTAKDSTARDSTAKAAKTAKGKSKDAGD
jgi:trigger factor